MIHFTARMAGIATLVLTALPVAALSTSVQAQPSVRVADLNLASAADRATFDQRVNAVADRICSRERDLSIRHGCEVGVRAEVNDKLAALSQSTQLAARPAAPPTVSQTTQVAAGK